MIPTDSIIGLVNGLNEVCKALDRKDALICVLAENCADPKYSKLVTVSSLQIKRVCRPWPRPTTFP